MDGHLFQNYDTRYMCGFFPRIVAIIPAIRYTCVFLPRIVVFFPALWGFYSQVYDHFLTNANIYAHKKAHIYALQTSMWYMGFTESRRIRGTDLYHQQKTPFMYNAAKMHVILCSARNFNFIVQTQ